MVRRKQVDNALGEVRELLQELRARVVSSKLEESEQLADSQARAVYDWADEVRRQARALVSQPRGEEVKL